MCKTETGDRRNFRCDRGNRQLFFGFFLPNHRFGVLTLACGFVGTVTRGKRMSGRTFAGTVFGRRDIGSAGGAASFLSRRSSAEEKTRGGFVGKGRSVGDVVCCVFGVVPEWEKRQKKPAVGTVGCKKASRGMRPHRFCRGNQRSMTPDPTSSSPSYHAANCPAVTPRWGSSKTMYPPSGVTWSVPPCNGCR